MTTIMQSSRKIWIDLDNSPHVPFFAPIISQLERQGFSILLTGRDCFQVAELAEIHGLKCRIVGKHHGRNRAMKVLGVGLRAGQLANLVLRERPFLAVSHGSRAQLLLSNLLRIPTIAIDDYEFSTRLGFIQPTWLLVPAVIPEATLSFDRKRILRYEGIKEDVYVPFFRPDPSFRKKLGFAEDSTLVTIRPPADEAHYHNPEAEILLQTLVDFLGALPDLGMVVLPRNEAQANRMRSSWPALFASGKISIPPRAVDGLNLIWHSDFVVSGGGTMNREAAALGVPVYSIFRGQIGAVDRYLSAQGRLVLLETAHDVRSKIVVCRRERRAARQSLGAVAFENVVSHIVRAAERTRPRVGSPSSQRESVPTS